jgi:tetratricopeptide (TPR) repeat protein
VGRTPRLAMNFLSPAASQSQGFMKQVCICLLLGIVALGAYSASFPGAFHFDDHPLLIENPRVTSPTFDYSSFIEMYGGRPLTLWTFHLNYRLFGAVPASFHGVNVFLHALAGILLYLLIRGWKFSWGVAFSAALLFVLHPAQAQAVDYVWARSLLLMAVFGLAALLLVRRHPWWALFLLQLAVWSRADALVLLVPLILLDRRLLKPGLVLAASDLACFVYGFVLASPAEFAWNHPGWVAFWLQAPLVLLHYLGWMIWPNRFSIFHGPSVISALPLIVAAGTVAALGVAALALGRRIFPIWIGMGWALLLLLPSVLIPNSEPFSESRAYLAIAGLALAAAWGTWTGAQSIGGRFRRPLLGRLVGIFVLAGLIIPAYAMTQERHRIWADDVALWREAVDQEPGEVLPNYNLAVALSNRGKTDEACRYFTRGVNLNPRDDMSYSGLGYCAEVNGQISRAAGYYSQALSLNDGNEYAREALHRLGLKPDPGEAKP